MDWKPLTALRARLTDDARLWWRFWSVRLHAAALGLLALYEPLLASINALPADVRALVPWMPMLAMVLGVAGLLARIVKQKEKPDA